MKKADQLPLRDIKITDAFFAPYISKMREKMLPYQWEIINDNVEGATKSFCIHNFKIAAGLEQGEFGGMVFQDTDVAKWLEAVSYSLVTQPDPALEKKADDCIELLEKAQWEDGYINTYFTLVAPDKRWSNLLECHELYTAGHLIEAAVAYFEATGKERFLKVVCRFADYICEVFGAQEEKCKGYPGHQEIELALVKLYRVTGERRYLALAEFFINQRGTQPLYFHEELVARNNISHFEGSLMNDPKYAQYHLPVREQTTAEGHAVRAVYMYCAMADLAQELCDDSLLGACKRLFDNIAEQKLYITAGIGSAHFGERFTDGYDLPNDSCYCETCASIGLALFALRMSRLTGEGYYTDVMERALYNTILSGVSQEFTEFFYVNPLEVIPAFIKNSTSLEHVKSERQQWFGVACCPTNIARTLGSLGQYIYSFGDSELTVNLYISGSAQWTGGHAVIESDYLESGRVTVLTTCAEPMVLRLRNPASNPITSLVVDGVKIPVVTEKGHVELCLPQGNCQIKLTFEMTARLVYANPMVSADAGRVAIMRGPLVYCLEQCDNGANLAGVIVDKTSEIEERIDAQLFGKTVVLHLDGWREDLQEWGHALYRTEPPKRERVRLKAIPYHLWNNRGEGEMRVWIRY